ncbi:hypothetical protein JD276_15650 [Leucobacter sp. CSA1]|uniref:Uncharacterized protein n=1 Tax=Leucobacter chromiisoli TaxID=2796471 RepID=A0A934QC62_9MICO|nr:hypothetical protein [Leucobacter chromiisoli]MBK0420459.1 hypothetical protein [Leucobacter chromiisoli]
MTSRPSRAVMCDWLSGALLNVARIAPSNPADIAELSARARRAEQRLRRLAEIAAELGWHVDADLDVAYELIQKYDEETP